MKRLTAIIMCAFLIMVFIPTARASEAPISALLDHVRYGASPSDTGIAFCASAEWDGESTLTMTVERAYSAFKPWYGDTASREKAVLLRVPVVLNGYGGGETAHVNDAPYVVGALGAEGSGVTLTVKLAKGGNKQDFHIAWGDGDAVTLSVEYVDLDTLKRFATAARGVNEPYFLARMSQDNAALAFDTALKNGIGGLTETGRAESGLALYTLEASLTPLNSAGKPLGEGYAVRLTPEAGTRSAKAIFGCDDDGVVYLTGDGGLNVTLIVADDTAAAEAADERYISLAELRKAEALTVGKWRVNVLDDKGGFVFEKTVSVVVNALTRLNTPMISIDRGAFLTLEEGGAARLKASVNGQASNKTIEWSSSNTAVASVTEDGAMTAHAPGVAYIKAAIPSVGAEALITVTVTALNVPVKHIVTHRSINLREQPDTEAASLGTVTRGEALYVVSQNDGWAKVEYERAASGYAYISERYLVPAE